MIGELNTRRFVEQRLLLIMNQSIRVTFLISHLYSTMYRESIMIVLWCRFFSENIFKVLMVLRSPEPRKSFFCIYCLPVKCVLLSFTLRKYPFQGQLSQKKYLR